MLQGGIKKSPASPFRRVVFAVVSLLSVLNGISVSAVGVGASAPRVVARLEGSAGAIIQFDCCGNTLLTVGGEEASIWDTATWRRTIGPLKHDAKITATALSPDGQYLVTAADAVRIWDARTGKPLHTLAHKGTINAAVFSLDGRRVFTAGEDAWVWIWDAKTGTMILGRRHPSSVIRMELSSDGRKVMTLACLRPGEAPHGELNPKFPEWQNAAMVAYVWDTATGVDAIKPERVDVWKGNPRDPWWRPAALSPDGSRLATFRPPEGVTVWDTTTREPLAEAPMSSELGDIGTETVAHVAFIHDSDQFLTTAVDGPAKVWTVVKGKQKPKELTRNAWERPGLAATVGPDGRQVLLASAGAATLIDVDANQVLMKVVRKEAEEAWPTAAFSPDGRMIAVGFAGDAHTEIFSTTPAAESKNGK